MARQEFPGDIRIGRNRESDANCRRQIRHQQLPQSHQPRSKSPQIAARPARHSVLRATYAVRESGKRRLVRFGLRPPRLAASIFSLAALLAGFRQAEPGYHFHNFQSSVAHCGHAVCHLPPRCWRTCQPIFSAAIHNS